jgi:hypothetical protein
VLKYSYRPYETPALSPISPGTFRAGLSHSAASRLEFGSFETYRSVETLRPPKLSHFKNCATQNQEPAGRFFPGWLFSFEDFYGVYLLLPLKLKASNKSSIAGVFKGT